MSAASWIVASKKMEPQITRNTQIQPRVTEAVVDAFDFKAELAEAVSSAPFA
jgi:hypothetical protein